MVVPVSAAALGEIGVPYFRSVNLFTMFTAQLASPTNVSLP